MTYGYLRLTDNQQTNLQQENLIKELALKKNLKVASIIKDQDLEDKNWKDRQLGSLLEQCKAGDTILVNKVDSISKSIEDIKEFLKAINEKDIILFVAAS